jgi:hypothetical protein
MRRCVCVWDAARELVRRYRQKLLLLFKLFLLERKVLFFKSPVVELSGLKKIVPTVLGNVVEPKLLVPVPVPTLEKVRFRIRIQTIFCSNVRSTIVAQKIGI